MTGFQVGDRVRGRADAPKETVRGKEGTIKAQVGPGSVGTTTRMVFEDRYDVQFDGMKERELLVGESWLEPA